MVHWLLKTKFVDDEEYDVLRCRVDILGTNCDQCVCMVQCCFTSTETIRLIRDGEKGGKRERDYIPIATLSPPE